MFGIAPCGVYVQARSRNRKSRLGSAASLFYYLPLTMATQPFKDEGLTVEIVDFPGTKRAAGDGRQQR